MHACTDLCVSPKIFWKRSEAATSLGWHHGPGTQQWCHGLVPTLCQCTMLHGPCYLSSLLNRYLPLPPFHFPSAGMVPILPTICGHSVAEMTRGL